jgi:hypothetical protein
MHITKTCVALKVYQGLQPLVTWGRAPTEIKLAIVLTTQECLVNFWNAEQSTCDVGGHLFICETPSRHGASSTSISS